MAVIFSDGAVRAIRGAAAGTPAYSPPVTDVLWLRGAYASLYRTNPSVRTAVDLLGRNIAQLGLHLFRRISTTDRERDRDSGPARLIARPSAFCSSYRLLFMTVVDLAIYGESIWWKEGAGGARDAIHRVNPNELRSTSGDDYLWTLTGRPRTVRAENFVRFWTYDPEDEYRACSLLETLRSTIAEDRAAAQHRMTLWRTGASIAGVIERPKDAGNWSDPARERFRTQWTERYSGAAGAGSVPVLEDGMKFKETSLSPAAAQSYETRKANTEEITRSYQIPLPIAGILDHATFSNVREMHKQLYQDCLGPITTQIESELTLQLLEEYGLDESHYFEFNINEKLKGSFEEQSASIGRAVGGPYLTINEGRALVNRPALDGGDRLYPQPGSGTPSAGPASPSAEEPDQAPAVHRCRIRTSSSVVARRSRLGTRPPPPRRLRAGRARTLARELDAGDAGPLAAIVLEARSGAKHGARDETVAGLAHIPVFGFLSSRPSLSSLFFGGASMAGIREAVAAAVAAPSVKGILLEIDSPGGAVYGAHETFAAIRAAASKKPVIAAITGLGASAGYWLAAAADRIVLTPSGDAGFDRGARRPRGPLTVLRREGRRPYRRRVLDDEGRRPRHHAADRRGEGGDAAAGRCQLRALCRRRRDWPSDVRRRRPRRLWRRPGPPRRRTRAPPASSTRLARSNTPRRGSRT